VIPEPTCIPFWRGTIPSLGCPGHPRNGLRSLSERTESRDRRLPSIANLHDDMPPLMGMAEVIRTYSSVNSLSNIAPLAAACG